jgi:hypothetical protein
MLSVEQRVVYRTREMQRLEAVHGEPMGDLLHRLYLEQGLTVAEVGAFLGITKGAASRWLERFSIEIRRARRVA